jgi:hypothetical protein
MEGEKGIELKYPGVEPGESGPGWDVSQKYGMPTNIAGEKIKVRVEGEVIGELQTMAYGESSGLGKVMHYFTDFTKKPGEYGRTRITYAGVRAKDAPDFFRTAITSAESSRISGKWSEATYKKHVDIIEQMAETDIERYTLKDVYELQSPIKEIGVEAPQKIPSAEDIAVREKAFEKERYFATKESTEVAQQIDLVMKAWKGVKVPAGSGKGKVAAAATPEKIIRPLSLPSYSSGKPMPMVFASALVKAEMFVKGTSPSASAYYSSAKMYSSLPSLESPSPSPSAYSYYSAYPSASISQSVSVSPSLSASASISPSLSPSLSISPSLSPSISPSASPSISPSISPSLSPSISPSASISISPSLSPSLSPSPSPGPGSPSLKPPRIIPPISFGIGLPSISKRKKERKDFKKPSGKKSMYSDLRSMAHTQLYYGSKGISPSLKQNPKLWKYETKGYLPTKEMLTLGGPTKFKVGSNINLSLHKPKRGRKWI